MRNSSLVKWFCADNPAGLKSATEAMVPIYRKVGERSLSSEVARVNGDGVQGSEAAGTSSARHVRNMPTEDLRFPTQGLSA